MGFIVFCTPRDPHRLDRFLHPRDPHRIERLSAEKPVLNRELRGESLRRRDLSNLGNPEGIHGGRVYAELCCGPRIVSP
jgi:hypothetical protein